MPSDHGRIFLLSPAHSAGIRAGHLVRPDASFDLARRVQAGTATLGEVFSFCSGLYFRGKVSYAKRFARPAPLLEGVQVITPSRGLVPVDVKVRIDDLREFASTAVDETEPRFTGPLEKSVLSLAAGSQCDVVLLGSIATGKYVDCLLPILGERLLFPVQFIGRGDMSRGALMLRSVDSGLELEYMPVAGAVRRGRRAVKFAEM